MKIIANYLPQYHQTPENDKWWGEGFTDWVSTRNAKPLFAGHEQPKVPLNSEYCDLSTYEAIKKQAELASKYGIDAFGIYHYWFSSSQVLLQKPAELLRKHEEIHIEYMFIWDNSSWVRSWKNVPFSNAWSPKYDKQKKTGVNDEPDILAKLDYGDENEWKKHFDYLCSYFKDKRYIKKNNRPVFAIFNQDNSTELLNKMISYWDRLAQTEGFDGIYVIGRRNEKKIHLEFNNFHEMNYIPGFVSSQSTNPIVALGQKFRKVINRKLGIINKYNYDVIWKRILKDARKNVNEKLFYSAIVNYDDTPRRGGSGSIFMGATPEKFYKYLKELIHISDSSGKDMIFITAWNEWGEGAFLEPDEKNQYKYLQSVKKAVTYENNCN